MKSLKNSRNIWALCGTCFLIAFILKLISKKDINITYYVLSFIAISAAYYNVYKFQKKINENKDENPPN